MSRAATAVNAAVLHIDASIDGDFSSYASSLPNRDFFDTDKVYVPFSGPNAMQEPLK